MSDDGFFQRWSRRKSLQSANAPDAPAPAPTDTAKRETPAAQTVTALAAPTKPLTPQPQAKADPTDAAGSPQPLPSLADTQSLTPESDFRPFMGQGVAPEVKNAAMKKLFADPHFNVMDRMDIYIDDYSQPDPLPLAMLRQMNGSQFLNLFAPEDPHAQPLAQPTDGPSALEASADPACPVQASNGDACNGNVAPDTAAQSPGPSPKT